MEIIKSRLIERIARAPGIESFRFQPEKPIDFTAGQFALVMFDPAIPANKDLNKYLSFSSSPKRQYVEFTKRLSASAFSTKLRALKSGDEVFLKAPMGSCVFNPDNKKIAFLIGGIGITPVISIIEYVIDLGLDNDIFLMYSNRTDEDIAFQKELDQWQAQNARFHVCYTVTECEPKDKRCLYGTINKDLVCGRMADARDRVFFIFGPPKMVEAMKTLCEGMGLQTDRIRTEMFVGY